MEKVREVSLNVRSGRLPNLWFVEQIAEIGVFGIEGRFETETHQSTSNVTRHFTGYLWHRKLNLRF